MYPITKQQQQPIITIHIHSQISQSYHNNFSLIPPFKCTVICTNCCSAPVNPCIITHYLSHMDIPTPYQAPISLCQQPT